MRSLRLVMMGTGDFALPVFVALCSSPHQVAGLYTQPERVGRGHHRQAFSRIKQAALERSVPVFQPENVNVPAVLDELRSLEADVFVVAAYGQILSAELLGIPRLAAINVHASLLPKYRGASPVEFAILKGESETGVSIIGVEPKLDAGPIYATVRTPIGPKETAGELEGRLAELAVPPALQVVDAFANGTAQGTLQDPQLVTRAPKLKKSMGEIDWRRPACEIDWQVRALQPWPNASTLVKVGEKSLRVLVLSVTPHDSASTSPPGTVLEAGPRLIVQTGSGSLEIERLQPEGKRPMPSTDFLRGNALRIGQPVC